MLSVVLKILSILGILLLCLLGLAVLMILLALFFPVSYKLTGKKDTERMTAGARASWLFGLLRVSFDYPEPGRFFVKVLAFTVFDSGKATGGKAEKTSGSPEERNRKGDVAAKKEEQAEKKQKQTKEEQKQAEEEQKQTKEEQKQAEEEQKQTKEEQKQAEEKQEETTAGANQEQQAADAGQEASSFLFKKIEKIKYTICSIYDKIKNIWENISYYMELLQEEETKQLFSHVVLRLGKILKSIRPRHIRGQVLFGTGSPDTTGYAYGVYGMLSPILGSRLLVTPDFTGAVLEGDLFLSGHITVFTILWNGLKVLSDKKLRRFIRKMKTGRKK